MNFEGLKRRVERAEQLVDGRIVQTTGHRAALGQRWREAWTPARIVIAGLLGGVLVAKARPLRTLGAVSGTRWVQLATSLSGLLASLKAAQSAESAEAAASGAEDAAAEAADTVEAVAGDEAGAPPPPAPQAGDDAAPHAVADRRRRPDAQWDSEPRPAEAATELSER
ncbi:protein sip-5 [Luteimonas marina]|uniref:Protein sip-5 n=1 Tax=Luteimonas marina TaxID=488485 RepID=A0A5C5U0R3_9GAMM|nr:protein sip-5 [Luteimonas marina]TWT19060.1 protein sip-5 [Luteimonas marina]